MNEVLFLTGANRGLGLALLEKYAKEGYDVIATTRVQYREFEDHCAEIAKTYNVKIHHIYMDLSNPESITAGLKVFKDLQITPTVLVNNASMPYDRIALLCKMDDVRKIFQVNYFSVVQITQQVAKAMMKGGGCIINISSVSSLTKQAAGTAYSASKAAINVFTQSLAQELSSFKIRVNAVAPGGMNTEMFTSTNDSNKQALIDSNALHRVGETTEVADVVFFLSSPNASYINGQIIRVDGGMFL